VDKRFSKSRTPGTTWQRGWPYSRSIGPLLRQRGTQWCDNSIRESRLDHLSGMGEVRVGKVGRGWVEGSMRNAVRSTRVGYSC